MASKRRAFSRLSFEGFPHVEHLEERLSFLHEVRRQDADHFLGPPAADEESLSGTSFDHASCFEDAQCLANAGAADRQLVGQSTLRRKLIARLEPSRRDQGLQLLHHVLVQPTTADGGERKSGLIIGQ